MCGGPSLPIKKERKKHEKNIFFFKKKQQQQTSKTNKQKKFLKKWKKHFFLQKNKTKQQTSKTNKQKKIKKEVLQIIKLKIYKKWRPQPTTMDKIFEKISSEIAHYGKILISIFQYFFASINKICILEGTLELGYNSMMFWDFPDLS